MDGVDGGSVDGEMAWLAEGVNQQSSCPEVESDSGWRMEEVEVGLEWQQLLNSLCPLQLVFVLHHLHYSMQPHLLASLHWCCHSLLKSSYVCVPSWLGLHAAFHHMTHTATEIRMHHMDHMNKRLVRGRIAHRGWT